MTAMGKQRELRQHWQRAAKLIPAKADVMEVSRALELALFMTPSSTCRKCRRNESPGAKFGGAGAGFGLHVQANRSVCADLVSIMARLQDFLSVTFL
jgi:hypothetical protein